MSREVDWEYVRKAGNYRKDRLATLRPDEEPDFDMLTVAELRNQAAGVENERLKYRSRYQRRKTSE